MRNSLLHLSCVVVLILSGLFLLGCVDKAQAQSGEQGTETEQKAPWKFVITPWALADLTIGTLLALTFSSVWYLRDEKTHIPFGQRVKGILVATVSSLTVVVLSMAFFYGWSCVFGKSGEISLSNLLIVGWFGGYTFQKFCKNTIPRNPGPTAAEN